MDPAAGEKYPALCREARTPCCCMPSTPGGIPPPSPTPATRWCWTWICAKTATPSKAHEAASRLLGAVTREKGDTLRYYNTSGTLRVLAPGGAPGPQPVEFYVETLSLPRACVRRDDGTELPCQVSPHPRGRRITFLDDFTAYASGAIRSPNGRRCPKRSTAAAAMWGPSACATLSTTMTPCLPPALRL